MERLEVFDLPVSLRIRRSSSAVFSAWIEPAIAEQWLCDRMEGRWHAGEKVIWIFGGIRQEIRVQEVEIGKRLNFRWNSHIERAETAVTIECVELNGEVRLSLLESNWELSAENVRLALDQACGWENVFCRLKAWIESGIKLR